MIKRKVAVKVAKKNTVTKGQAPKTAHARSAQSAVKKVVKKVTEQVTEQVISYADAVKGP